MFGLFKRKPIPEVAIPKPISFACKKLLELLDLPDWKIDNSISMYTNRLVLENKNLLLTFSKPGFVGFFTVDQEEVFTSDENKLLIEKCRSIYLRLKSDIEAERINKVIEKIKQI